ncbi:B3 domain-containing protein, DNA-binding pseudobarrel domain protein [Tanacetum coccineum]
MAFRPYKRPPQLIDFLNLFSKDCPSPLTSTSFTNLPSEAEPEFIELSLGVKEKLALENENEIEVRLVGPTLKMYKEPMRLIIWNMTNTRNLVLKTNWYRFVEDNKEHLKELSKIQLWSFRKDHQLCFALAVVARPPEGLNSVAN